MKSSDPSAIIFFDGVCHLCNGFVNFVIRHDSQKKFKFAPLQGVTAKQSLDIRYQNKLDSVLVKIQDQVLEQSDAITYILSELDGLRSLAFILKLIPSPIRNQLYAIVAKYRYSWFGQSESCRLPTPAEKNYLLP